MVYKLLQIKYGDTTIPANWICTDNNPDERDPIILSVFYIETESKKILIDAGCETMPGFVVENFENPIDVIERKGIRAENITDIVLTHSHHDHVQCVRYFPGAIVHIQEDELADVSKYLSNNPNVQTFQNEFSLDSDVRVLKIGGHSVGSCIVECNYLGKIYVLCGDECYSYYNLTQIVPTGSTYCVENSKSFVEKYSQAPYICCLCHKHMM